MSRALSFFHGRQDLALIGLLMVTILVMIIPLPTWLIDVLIACNITLTLMVLLVAVYVKRPEEFTSFPAIILFATTFRLAITISTTRLILAHADAGAIIDTFGNFVTQGSVVVGLVIFLIITTVQFVVITKGSERIAEVAARFNLDGLPGRQMSIDSELRAGDITPEEAQRKRAQLEKENQFFGAMDGAMKFVKGDAIAGIIVVAINLLGGISIGMVAEGMNASAAVDVYSRLTVGDGLVSQIPALIVALCAGTIITRVNSGEDSDLGSDIFRQLGSQSKSLFLGAALVAIMSLIPGFPTPIFLAVAAGMIATGYFLSRREKARAELENEATVGAQRILEDGIVGQAESQAAKNDVLSIAVGSSLYNRIDKKRFVEVRNIELAQLSERTGVQIPAFGIYLDDSLEETRMAVILDQVSCFRADIPEGVAAAICDGDLVALNELPVVPLDSNWPVQPAYWVDESSVKQLNDADIEVLQVSDLIARTASLIMANNISRILGHQQVQQVVRELGNEHENLAAQISQSISAVQLLNVLRRLIEDKVPLMPRRILFESLLESTVSGGSTQHFVEAARLALSRQICAHIADENRIISGYVIEPELEVALQQSLIDAGEEKRLVASPDVTSRLVESIRGITKDVEHGVSQPIILTNSELRASLSDFARQHNIEVQILSFMEISREFVFHPIGTLGGVTNPVNDNMPEAA